MLITLGFHVPYFLKKNMNNMNTTGEFGLAKLLNTEDLTSPVMYIVIS